MLTKYREGGLRELWTLSFPLMISMLSGNLMQFADRVILARYSTEAMNAAGAAGMAAMLFLYGVIAVASIAEVFVGQYNGAGQQRRVARPVWQMLWLTLFSWPLFLLVARYGGPYLLGDYHYETMGLPYFQWTMALGPALPAVAALSSFFVGLGKTRLVMWLTLLANAANVFLDLLLVPQWGTAGAAIASGISQWTQVLVLFILFLPQTKYGTRDWAFHPRSFLRCLKIGLPASVGHMIEIGAWVLIDRVLMGVSAAHLTVIILGQSFFSLITFVEEGLQKGVTALASNFIGARRWEMAMKTHQSALKLLVILGLLAAIPLLIYPTPLIRLFAVPEGMESLVRITCIGVWLYLMLDGAVWVTAGVLTAAGDTRFIMVMNAVGAWLFAVVPVTLFVLVFDAPATAPWILINFYAAANCIAFMWRLRGKKWKQMQVMV
jgi:multidrug resistance protein, MATE family